MTNNLTTIAALPSGSGCKSSLPSEVGKVRKIGWPFLVAGAYQGAGDDRTVLVLCPRKMGKSWIAMEMEKARQEGKWAFKMETPAAKAGLGKLWDHCKVLLDKSGDAC